MSSPATLGAPRVARAGKVALGLLWLIDGALQFQPSMFGQGFIDGVILPGAKGQPAPVAAAISWLGGQIAPHVALFNAGAASLQILIGLGLLYRRTVKLSLLVSFAWVGAIWFAGEGLGMLLTGNASPLTGAPGAAAIYVVAGLLCWPGGGAGGANGANGAARCRAAARWCLSIAWLGSAALWLLPANSMAGSVNDQIAGAPSGAEWLSSLLGFVAHATAGRGTLIAVAMSAISAAIGASVLTGWRRASSWGCRSSSRPLTGCWARASVACSRARRPTRAPHR